MKSSLSATPEVFDHSQTMSNQAANKGNIAGDAASTGNSQNQTSENLDSTDVPLLLCGEALPASMRNFVKLLSIRWAGTEPDPQSNCFFNKQPCSCSLSAQRLVTVATKTQLHLDLRGSGAWKPSSADCTEWADIDQGQKAYVLYMSIGDPSNGHR